MIFCVLSPLKLQTFDCFSKRALKRLTLNCTWLPQSNQQLFSWIWVSDDFIVLVPYPCSKLSNLDELALYVAHWPGLPCITFTAQGGGSCTVQNVHEDAFSILVRCKLLLCSRARLNKNFLQDLLPLRTSLTAKTYIYWMVSFQVNSPGRILNVITELTWS